MLRRLCLLATLATGLLAGCDMLGIESPEKLAALREAEGRAVGGACRHAGRAIEDCYTLNRRIDKAAIFAGWRDMNDYMRENKIEAVPPVLVAQAPAKPAKAEAKAAEPEPDAKDGKDGKDEADKAKPKPRDAKS